MLRAPSPNILKKHGVEPAPERSRKTTWNEFLNRHWQQIVATDFFTVEVWTTKGLQRFVVLFFLELSTRRARPMAPQSMVTIALSSDMETLANFAVFCGSAMGFTVNLCGFDQLLEPAPSVFDAFLRVVEAL
jgi:hypothetical protein